MSRESAREGFIVAALIVITLVVFLPLTRYDFINYDDDVYVTANPFVNQGLSWRAVVWAFRVGNVDYWHPLSWLSHMLDCTLFGANAGLHHATSVAFHVANVLVLFYLLRRMTGAVWRSAIVAALFAVHPLHVESVAWITERKDVMSAFFALLTMFEYVRYAERRAPQRYAAVAVLFVLGLMAKPSITPLPALLLCLDYWPLNRINRDDFRAGFRDAGRLCLEKAPLFAISLASSVLTYVTLRKAGAIGSFDQFPMHLRLAAGLYADAAYLLKTVFPYRLAVHYPHPAQNLPWARVALAAVFLAWLTFIAARQRRTQPYLLSGWLWYLAVLVPFMVAAQAVYADRYTYFSLIGIFSAAVWCVADGIAGKPGLRRAAAAGSVLILAVFAALASFQVRHWRDSVALFSHSLRVSPDDPLALNNLGTALVDDGRIEEATDQFCRAIRLSPEYLEAHNNLGVALLYQDRAALAADQFGKALALNPDDPEIMLNRGVALAQDGQIEEATRLAADVLQQAPDYEPARSFLKALRDKGIAVGNRADVSPEQRRTTPGSAPAAATGSPRQPSR